MLVKIGAVLRITKFPKLFLNGVADNNQIPDTSDIYYFP